MSGIVRRTGSVVYIFAAMAEIWRDIPGYEGLYQASNLGRIKSLRRLIYRKNQPPFILQERILKQQIPDKNKRYLSVRLTDRQGVSKNQKVHRLIALVFIANPDNKPEINHIDGNPKNNTPDNLNWVTRSENQIHAYQELGVKARSIPRAVIRISNTGEQKIFKSITGAANASGIRHYNNIIAAIKKGRKSGGYNWRYYDGSV